MTPLGLKYEEAYAQAFPFNMLFEETMQQEMVAETAELRWRGLKQGVKINICVPEEMRR
jgi:hypothetical protein